MNLCVDIGNTRAKIGLFQGENLVQRLVWKDWTIDQLIEFGVQNGVKSLLYASVVQHDAALTKQLSHHFQTMELTTDSSLPFENQYHTPHTLGKDRLAAVAGAQALFPNENCLVIDCGTCIKYDILTSEGVYLGGNISPGANMRIQAMHHFTARLPTVPMEMPGDFIGHSTESALQNGALRGASLEIDGFIRHFKQKYASLRVVLTGGDANFFQAYLPLPNDSIVPDLTLYGLNNILTFHRETQLP
jgi:type III pantothenate kinase